MRICIVGVGSIAQKHIQNIKSLIPSAEIHAFRSSGKSLPDTTERLVDRQLFSLNELEENYDSIFICTPTALHLKSLTDFAPYSDCFFIEKPVFSHAQAPGVVDRFSDKKIYVASPLRYHPIVKRSKQIIETFGTPICARILCSSYLPDWRPGIDYRTVYSARNDLGGGVDIDLIHEVDYMVHLFGDPKSKSTLKGKFSALEIDSFDYTAHLFDYRNFAVEMHLDYFGRKNQRYLELFYDDRYIKSDIRNNRIEIYADTCQRETMADGDMYKEELKNFFAFCQGETCVRNDLGTANKILKLAGE